MFGSCFRTLRDQFHISSFRVQKENKDEAEPQVYKVQQDPTEEWELLVNLEPKVHVENQETPDHQE